MWDATDNSIVLVGSKVPKAHKYMFELPDDMDYAEFGNDYAFNMFTAFQEARQHEFDDDARESRNCRQNDEETKIAIVEGKRKRFAPPVSIEFDPKQQESSRRYHKK